MDSKRNSWILLPFRELRATWRSVRRALFPIEAWEPVVFLFFFSVYGLLGLNALRHSDLLQGAEEGAGSYLGYDNLFHLTTNGGAFDISHPLFNFFHITKWAIVKVVDMAAHTDIRAVFCLSLMNFLVSSGLVLLYRYLKRIVLLPVRRALLLTLLCGGSFTTIVLSFTTETYPFSFFLLILSLLVLSWEYKMRRRYQTYTMTVFALLLGGVTISNAGKPLLASLVGVSSFGLKVRNACLSLMPLLVCVILAFGMYSLKNTLMPTADASPMEATQGLLRYFHHDEQFAHEVINDFWANTFMTTPLSPQFVGQEQVFRPTEYLQGWQYAVPFMLLFLSLASILLHIHKNPYVQMLCLYFLVDLAIHLGLGYGMNEAVLFGGHFLFLIPMLIGWLYRKLPMHVHKTLDITLVVLLLCILTFNSMELNRIWTLISQ